MIQLRLDDREQLVSGLARGVDEFHDSLAKVAVVIDTSEAEVAERQPAQRLERGRDRDAPVGDAPQQLLQGGGVGGAPCRRRRLVSAHSGCLRRRFRRTPPATSSRNPARRDGPGRPRTGSPGRELRCLDLDTGMAAEVPDTDLAEAEGSKSQLCRLDPSQPAGGDGLPNGIRLARQADAGRSQPSTPTDRASSRSWSLVIPASASGERTPSSAAADMPGRSRRCVSEAFVPSTTQA